MNFDKIYEKLLNTVLSGEFSWFKSIEINRTDVVFGDSYLLVFGTIYIDSDWIDNRLARFFPHIPYKEFLETIDDFNFGDFLISDELFLNLRNIFIDYYRSIHPHETSIDSVGFSTLNVSPQSNLNESKKIIKETVITDGDYLNIYNELLKRFMSDYDWFKGINVSKIGIDRNLDWTIGQITPVGEIFVDHVWAYNQWREYQYSKPIPEEFDLGEIIGGEFSKELQNKFKTSFISIFGGTYPKRISFSWIIIRMVDESINENVISLNEDLRIDFVKKIFDRFFDELTVEKDDHELIMYSWFNSKRELIFNRNHWGTLWIDGCEDDEWLRDYTVIGLNYTLDEHKELLRVYMNERYREEFEDRPLRRVDSEICDDYY